MWLFFLEIVLWRPVLVRTDTWRFFWKLPGERACDVLLEWMPERTYDVCKEYKSTHGGRHSRNSSPCNSWLVFWDLMMLAFAVNILHRLPCFFLRLFACCDLIEKNAPKRSWYFACFLPFPWTSVNWWSLAIFPGSSWSRRICLLLIHVWCLQSGPRSYCWFVLGVLLVDQTTDSVIWVSSQNYFSKDSQRLFLIKSPPTSGGW